MADVQYIAEGPHAAVLPVLDVAVSDAAFGPVAPPDGTVALQLVAGTTSFAVRTGGAWETVALV